MRLDDVTQHRLDDVIVPPRVRMDHHECQWESDLKRLFMRYDMDASGKIDSRLELEQLCINALVKCRCAVVNPLPQIEQLLDSMTEERINQGMEFPDFNDWFHTHWSLPGCPGAHPLFNNAWCTVLESCFSSVHRPA